MKYIAIAALALSSSFAVAEPIPGGNPNCSTNWVGGACGPISNNKYQPSFCEKHPDSDRCSSCNRDEKNS